jgi:hypothetical protein
MATPSGGLPSLVAGDDSHYYGVRPVLSLEKRTNGQDADGAPGSYVAEGDVVTWTYVVHNEGNVPLSRVAVSDDQVSSVSCPTSTLAAGTSMTCTMMGTASAGQYANLGTVVGTPPVGTPVEASDPSHYYGVRLAIELEKQTDGQNADTPPGPTIKEGTVVTWSYLVTNRSNVRLTQIQVTDDQGLTVACPGMALGAGESMTCTATGTATVGQYRNLGTVSGQFQGTTVSDEDPSYYLGGVKGYAVFLPTILR